MVNPQIRKIGRRYKTIGIQAGIHTFTVATPCPMTSATPSTASTTI